MKKLMTNLLIATILALGTSLASAGDMMPEGEMNPEQQMMMERFAAYATPGENHELLKKMEGTWTAEITHKMTPESEPEMFTGISKAQMTIGGRFLEQNFTGEYMGQPFVGRGIYGYDNLRKEFTGIWYDNMGTGIMNSNGTYNGDTMTIKEEGSLSCPMTNGDRWYRAETKFIDENNYTYETYMKDEAGNEYRAMIIKYTRSS